MLDRTEVTPLDHTKIAPAGLLDMASDDSIKKSKWPRQLLNMVETLTSVWVRHGISPEEAATRAREGVAALAWSQGGRPVYLPVGRCMAIAVRDAAMFAEYTYRPDDIGRLREKYAITSEGNVFKILREQKALSLQRRKRT